MPIEMGPLCQYCVDGSGKLKPFEERFESFIQWTLKREPSLDRAAAERKTRDYMRSMPAWKTHPNLR
jgi:hypothetical protein